MFHASITELGPRAEGIPAQELLSILSSAFEQSPVSIVITDTQGRIEYVNRKTLEITGYTFEELRAQNLRILKSGETSPEEFRKYLEKGEWHGVFQNRKKNGEFFWEAATISPLRNAEGIITHYLAIKEDISERRAIETALRESEERFRVAAEHASDLIWELNLNDLRLQVYGPVKELLGMSSEEIGGRFENWIRTVHPDDLPIVETMVHTYSRRRRLEAFQYCRIMPDGSVRYWADRGTTLVDESGHPYKWIGVSSDITERKTATEALARSEQLYRTIVETAAEGIWMTDSNWTVTFVNPQMAETLAIQAEDLLGRQIRDFVNPEDLRELYRVREVLKSGAKTRWECRMRRRDGSQIWVNVSSSPLFGPDGHLTGALGMITDITETKRAEDELRLSRERFRLVAESVGDIIYEWDIETDRVQVLGGKQRVLNLGEDNEQEFKNQIHPDDLARFESCKRELLERGGTFSIEYRVAVPGQGYRIWKDNGVLFRDGTGKPVKQVGVTKDVTEIRAAERANAELAAIVENVDAAVISRDTRGRVLTWNPGAERIYGYPAAEMIGRNSSAITPDDRRREQASILTRILDGDRVQNLETIRLTKQGDRISVLLTVSPILDPTGKVAGSADVSWDISNLKTLQRQLAHAQKLESIGQLAAGVAHEINTPIQYIGDNAKFLEDAFQELIGLQSAAGPDPLHLEYLTQEIPKAISELQDGVERVARIVRAMKAFSHPGPVEKTATDINAAIESAIIVSRHEWKYLAEMVTDLDPNLPLVPCIASEFTQVILNLIVNAAQAIAEVREESGPPGRIRISTNTCGNNAEIRIGDTGPGIPEEIRGKIFDPFFTTKEVGKGTGQGLAIAHAVIVQKHRGTIHFETSIGQGSTFIIRLPLEGDS